MEFFLRQVYPWLMEVSFLSPVLPIIAGLFLIKNNKSLQFRLLFGFAVFIGICEAISKLTVIMGTKNNIWLFHVYTVVEYFILATIFYHNFKNPVIKKGIIFSAVALLILSLVDATMIEGITQMNATSKMVASALLIIFPVLYFYKVANDLSITYLDRDPIFLLSCGILIYKAGTSMSFAMFNDALAQSYDAARICITILLILNILFNTSLVFVLRKASVC